MSVIVILMLIYLTNVWNPSHCTKVWQKLTTKSVDILNSETQSTICVKDRKDDRLISGKILDNGAWEEKEVNLMMKMVDQYPEAIFLDIGSNLGILFVLVL